MSNNIFPYDNLRKTDFKEAQELYIKYDKKFTKQQLWFMLLGELSLFKTKKQLENHFEELINDRKNKK